MPKGLTFNREEPLGWEAGLDVQTQFVSVWLPGTCHWTATLMVVMMMMRRRVMLVIKVLLVMIMATRLVTGPPS